MKRNSYIVNGTETWSGWRPLNATNQRLNNMDFNRYIAPGVYAVGATPLNAPGSGDWGLLIVEVSGDVVIQTSKGMNNNIWTRFKTNAQTWSAWEQVLTTIHYNQLFQSVSNGKTAIASAISDGGVYTSPVETFANMANNIRLLYGSGLRMARGTAVGTTRIDVPAGTFGFTPKLVLTRGSVLTAGYLGMYSPPNTGLLGGYQGDALQVAAGRGGHASAAEEIMHNSSVRNGGFSVQVAPSNYYPYPGISFEWIAFG